MKEEIEYKILSDILSFADRDLSEGSTKEEVFVAVMKYVGQRAMDLKEKIK